MTAPPKLSVSVAILTWNRRQQVKKAIESVLNQTYKPTEIVVVDSASIDGTVDSLLATYDEIKVIRLHRNLGCPEGRNVAMANCTGDIIYALDDDGWLAPNTLETCVSRFASNPKVGVVACRILPPDEKSSTATPDSLSETFSGGASAIRRQALEKCGYYPSDFFRQAEEGDLSLRLFDVGYTVLRCPEAVMFHERSPENRRNKWFYYYSCRNELLTIMRRYPWYAILPAFLQKVFSWNFIGVRDRALMHTALAVLVVIAKTPSLLRQRNPVSWRAIRFILIIKYRRRFPNAYLPPAWSAMLNKEQIGQI